MTTKPPAKRTGRPGLAGEGSAPTYTLRMPEDLRAKIDRNGGPPWLRELVKKAPETSARRKKE